MTNIPSWLVLVGDALSVGAFAANMMFSLREEKLNVAAARAAWRLSGEAAREECRHASKGFCIAWSSPQCSGGRCKAHCIVNCGCK